MGGLEEDEAYSQRRIPPANAGLPPSSKTVDQSVFFFVSLNEAFPEKKEIHLAQEVSLPLTPMEEIAKLKLQSRFLQTSPPRFG